MVADTPDEKIELKAFHCAIQNDHKTLKVEEDAYQPIPVIRKIDQVMVHSNYTAIKNEIREIVNAELQKLI